MSAHLDDDLLAGLDALSADDSQRREADAHLASCEPCRVRLDESRRVLAALDVVPIDAADAVRIAQIHGRVVAEMRRGRTPALALAAAIATCVGAVVLTSIARHRSDSATHWAEAVVFLAIAIAVVAATSWKRDVARLLAVVVAAVGLAVVAGGAPGLSPMVGIKCVLLEQVAAMFPLGVAAFVLRRGGAPSSPLVLAVSASAGALAGMAALHLTCPAHAESPHLFAFHVGGVVLAAMLGWASSRLVAVRRAV